MQSLESLEARRLLANELLTWAAGMIIGDITGGSRGGIFISRANGADMRQITTSQTNNYEFSGHGLNLPDDHPSFSPDGKQIVFSTSRFQEPGDFNNFEIAIMNVDGTNIRRLTNASGIDTEPQFSPDGTKIAFVSTRSGNHDIWVMNADGSNPTRLTTSANGDTEPAWNHAGTKIAFGRVVDPGFIGIFDAEKDIWVMNADGSGQTQITSIDAEEHDPVWSLDDSKLIITSEIDNTLPFGDVVTINATTCAKINNLTIDDRTLFIGGGGDPTLSPDGTKIAYFKATGGPLLLAGPQKIHVMNANGSGKVKIDAPGIINVHPHFGNTADSDLDGVPDYMDASSPAQFNSFMSQDEQRVRSFLGGLTKIDNVGGIGLLAARGYLPGHNFNSFNGLGVAFARDVNFNDPSEVGKPDILFYAPDLTPNIFGNQPDVTDAFGDYPYRLIGWGYISLYNPTDVPGFAGLPADAWSVHEAGFHNIVGGTFQATPPSGDAPKGSKIGNVRPNEQPTTPWHPRLWNVLLWTNPSSGGTPKSALTDPFGRNLPGFSSSSTGFFPQIPFEGVTRNASNVEFEEFDMAKNFGWLDNSAGNNGTKFRVTDVDVSLSLDSDTNHDVTSIEAGEFLAYTLNFAGSGLHQFSMTLRNGRSGGKFHVEIDGVNKSGSLSLPITTDYETVVPFSTSISAGKHQVKIVFETAPSGAGAAPRLDSFSFTRQTAPAASMASIRTITSPSGFTDIFVTYRDDTAINQSSLDGDDIRVSTVDGFNVAAAFVSKARSFLSRSTTATYRVAAPGGSWDSADNGVYVVQLQTGQVLDDSGMAALPGTLGVFRVDVKQFALAPNFPLTTSTLVINGSDAADLINITRVGSTLNVFNKNTPIGSANQTTISKIIINGAAGNDQINAAAVSVPATIDGGDGNDTMAGGLAADVILGGGGADQAINPHIGPDSVDLGPETSAAQGVRFSGTNRNDTIVVRRQMRDGAPRMIFETSFGRFIFGVTGCRTVIVDGRDGDDVIFMHATAANFWRAQFSGGGGNDTLIGGALSDTLRGGAGNDKLVGKAGSDLLVGGDGKNRVIF